MSASLLNGVWARRGVSLIYSMAFRHNIHFIPLYLFTNRIELSVILS